jgi:hypothetical protein
VVKLLHDIAMRSDKNKMGSSNLATVFMPIIFFSVQVRGLSLVSAVVWERLVWIHR